MELWVRKPGHFYIKWRNKVSYINEALKKAQRDRDARRIRRIGIWKNVQKGNKSSKKIIVYTLLSALAIGLGLHSASVDLSANVKATVQGIVRLISTAPV